MSELRSLVQRVNTILAQELRLTEKSDAGPVRIYPGAMVGQSPERGIAPFETPFGFFLPIMRTVVGPDQRTVTKDQIKAKADDLSSALGVNVAFEWTPNGGPLQLWVPKPSPDASYFFHALRYANLDPLAGIVGVDRRNVPVVVSLDEDAIDRHIMISGSTTVGKSFVADIFLLSMAFYTSPQQLRLVVLDCKNRAHARWQALPHTLAYAGGGYAQRKEILSEIRRLERLLDKRQTDGISRPVIVALFDDGREPEAWSDSYRDTMGKLLRLGASAGIRIVITAHEIKETWFGDASRTNLNTRIVSSNDVTKTASQVGRGGSRAYEVDQTLRQFVLMRNNRVDTIYAPHVCQKGRFLDLNRNDVDDVDEVIAACERRWQAVEPLPEDEISLSDEDQAPQPAFAVDTQEPRVCKGRTFEDAVLIVRELLSNHPEAIPADVAKALWNNRRTSGYTQTRFVTDVLTAARKEG